MITMYQSFTGQINIRASLNDPRYDDAIEFHNWNFYLGVQVSGYAGFTLAGVILDAERGIVNFSFSGQNLEPGHGRIMMVGMDGIHQYTMIDDKLEVLPDSDSFDEDSTKCYQPT